MSTVQGPMPLTAVSLSSSSASDTPASGSQHKGHTAAQQWQLCTPHALCSTAELLALNHLAATLSVCVRLQAGGSQIVGKDCCDGHALRCVMHEVQA